MHELDGSAGGGQLVRTALSCAALTGDPFRMEDVRGARPNPGLRAQHLAAVRAAAAVCSADVGSIEVGSESLTFDPGPVAGGDHELAVGTAGSVPLVFDAVLPVAYALPSPFTLAAAGGTDVKWAPTFDHYRRVKLPLVCRTGLDAGTTVQRRGFYPAGGGEATLSLAPSTPARLDLASRGALERVTVHSVASKSLGDADVANRQADAAVRALDVDVTVKATADYVGSDSPGSAVLVRGVHEESVAGFDALGERGRPAETVGEAAVEAFERFERSGAAVDERVADQVMLPLAVAGGEVTVPRITDHVETNAEAVRAFGGDVRIEEGDPARIVSAGGLGAG